MSHLERIEHLLIERLKSAIFAEKYIENLDDYFQKFVGVINKIKQTKNTICLYSMSTGDGIIEALFITKYLRQHPDTRFILCIDDYAFAHYPITFIALIRQHFIIEIYINKQINEHIHHLVIDLIIGIQVQYSIITSDLIKFHTYHNSMKIIPTKEQHLYNVHEHAIYQLERFKIIKNMNPQVLFFMPCGPQRLEEFNFERFYSEVNPENL